MATTLKRLTDDALSLSIRQRAILARVLISSMDRDFQQDIDNAWEAELEKRIQDIRFGKVKGVPAAEVFAKLREKYR